MGEISNGLINDNILGINRDEVVKYYIVWKGRKPGIYKTWDECKVQVDKFTGAKYKSFFCDYTEAEIKYADGVKEKTSSAPKNIDPSQLSTKGYITKSLAVDAACASNPGPVEYRGVNVETGKIIFTVGPLLNGTNNIGEFLAIVHALALMKLKGSTVPVYSDSETAIGWVKKKKANTTLEKTSTNQKIFELVQRAENWLAKNTYTNLILKWETKNWGEIPADFGRKK